MVFGADPVSLVSPGALARLGRSAEARLRDFHGTRRLQWRDAARGAAAPGVRAVPDGVFEAALTVWRGWDGRDGRERGSSPITRCGSLLEEAQARTSLLARGAGRGAEPASDVAHPPGQGWPRIPASSRRWARALAAEGALRRVGDSLDQRPAGRPGDEVRRRWPPGSRLTWPVSRKMTGSAAEFVIPLLEYLTASA